MEKTTDIIKKLDKIVDCFSRVKDINTLIHTTEEVMEENFSAEYRGLYLYNSETDKLELHYTSGFSREERAGAEHTAMERHPGWVFKNRKPLLINDMDNYRDGIARSSPRRHHVRSRICIPSITENECVGVCSLASVEPNHFNTVDESLLFYICRLIGMAYKNILLKKFHDESEEILARNEAYYRSLIQNSTDIITILENDGSMRFVSNSIKRVLGYEREEAIGLCVLDLCHPNELARDQQLFAQIIGNPGITKTLEVVVRHKNGSWRHLEITANNLIDDPIIRGMVCNARDITDRKETESHLMLLSSAVEGAAESIVITDNQGVIRYVNPAFEKITGYSRKEARGANPRILKSGKHEDEFYRNLWDTVTGGEIWSGTLINRRKDGILYHEEATIFPVRDACGMVTHYTKVAHDATEKIQLESQLRQAQKMEAVGRLAGGIAHDFNNLLMGIIGGVELARIELSDNHSTLQYIDEIEKAAEKAGDLIRQLLTFSRKRIISPRVLNLNNVVRDVEKMLRRVIGENIEVVIKLDDRIKNIKVDQGQMEQVIMNLVVNARDALPRGGKIVLETGITRPDESVLKIFPHLNDSEYVFLSVIDDGDGMEEEVLSHIFEPFFTTKERGKGTGLGLATVYGIIQQSRGYIIPVSTPGMGTAITICLPLADEKPVHPKRKQKIDSSIPRGTEKVLVVEDDEMVRVQIKRFLEYAGYHPSFAKTGEEALEIIGRWEGIPDLLIIDLVLPGISGRELSESVKSRGIKIKTLFMSGYSEDVIARHHLAGEKVEFIGKPFSLEDFLVKIRNILDRRDDKIIQTPAIKGE